MWNDIERCGNDPTPEERERLPPGKTARDLMLETREVDRDVSFIRRWLGEPLMRELDLIRVEPRGDDLVISDVSDQEGWRTVKELLLKSVGMGSAPVIRIAEADHGGNRTLLLSLPTTVATCTSRTPGAPSGSCTACGAVRSCSRP
jgi:stage V sporulation protein R